jgi:hypothetical protein
VSALESRYRRLLRIYPPTYRRESGEEVLGTLLQASAGRRSPSLRETAGLIVGGITARARAVTRHPVSWWADGLHLGILLIALANLALDLAYVYPEPWNGYTPWVIGSLVLTVALVRGWLWVALPLALASAVPTVGGPLLGTGPRGVLAAHGPVYAGPQTWSLVVQYLAMAAGLIALALRPSRELRRRSYGWLLVPLVVWTSAHTHTSMTWTVRPILVILVLAAGVWATAAARDLRWLVAATIFVPATIAPDTAMALAGSGSPTANTVITWGIEVGLTMVMGRTALRTRRPAA